MRLSMARIELFNRFCYVNFANRILPTNKVDEMKGN